MTRYYGEPPGGFTPPTEIDVTIDSVSTLSSGGTLDWHGRASIKRRPSDDALVLVYRRGSNHAVNDGGLYIRFSDDDGATWTAENTRLASDGGGAVTGFPMNPSSLSAGQDAGEPWLMVAPNGDLLLHMWRVDYGVSNGGTYQSRSDDGGLTWSAADGPIAWAGLTSDQNLRTFATDDDFVKDGVIYCGARVYGNLAGSTSAVVLCTSDDDGVTWTRLTTLISAAASEPPGGTQEVGLELVGPNTILAMIRDDPEKSHGYKMVSANLGVTFGSLQDVTADAGRLSRPRVYTRAHLKGEADWWLDPVLIMVGFTWQVAGDSHPRRHCIWVSSDSGATWDGPFYLDDETEDAGYGDVFYDAGNDQYVVVNYQGSLAAASLKQYRLTIAGI